MDNQFLSPLEAEPKTFKIGAFDTETKTNNATYDLGGVYVDNEFYLFNDPHEMIKFMVRKKYEAYRFFAHNLSYDFGVLIDHIEKEHESLFINGKCLFVKHYLSKKNRVFWGDSWMLSANLPLSIVGDSIQYPKLPTPSEYLPVEFDQSSWMCLEHHKTECPVCYLHDDCKIVYDFIDLLQHEINRLGGELKWTLASTAMDLWRRKYLDTVYLTPFPFRNGFARNAYYGGRVEPFRIGYCEDVNIYDVNSLYPYVMKSFEYPNPNTMEWRSDTSEERIIQEYDGVSEIRICVPQTNIPLLPFRTEESLFFPTGTFEGTYTHREIREAVKRGAQIKHIYKQLYSLTNCSPFESYVTDLYALRMQYKNNRDTKELIIKILLNSLYGKFGQRSDTGLEKLISMDDYFDSEDTAGMDFVVYDDVVYARKPVKSDKQPSYINTMWAAHITAYARLTLFSYLEEVQDTLIYCDTDSIFTTSELPTGKNLGELKLEYKNVDVHILAPKLYQIFEDGKLIRSKVRGVPKRYQQEFIGHKQVAFMRSLGFFEAHRRKLHPSMWVEVVKHMEHTTPKRELVLNSDKALKYQLTLPWNVDNLP